MYSLSSPPACLRVMDCVGGNIGVSHCSVQKPMLMQRLLPEVDDSAPSLGTKATIWSVKTTLLYNLELYNYVAPVLCWIEGRQNRLFIKLQIH